MKCPQWWVHNFWFGSFQMTVATDQSFFEQYEDWPLWIYWSKEQRWSPRKISGDIEADIPFRFCLLRSPSNTFCNLFARILSTEVWLLTPNWLWSLNGRQSVKRIIKTWNDILRIWDLISNFFIFGTWQFAERLDWIHKGFRSYPMDNHKRPNRISIVRYFN